MSCRLLPLLPALLFVASLGCGGKPSPAPKAEPAAEPTTPAPPTTKPADPNAPSGEPTFNYWAGVARWQELAARKYAALAEPKPDEVKALLTEAAKGIEALPTERVDPDAVLAGKRLAEVMRVFASDKAAEGFLSEMAAEARATRTALGTKYGREFPTLDVAGSKEPVFRLVADLARPTAAQELAKLRGELAKLDEEIKGLNKELSDETFKRDKLQSEADSVRAILKEQTSDADLKKVRQEVLDDAVKDVEASKKVIDGLTKKLNPLRARRGELGQWAAELDGILKEGDPEKADKLPPHKLESLRTQTERVYEKMAAPKAKK